MTALLPHDETDLLTEWLKQPRVAARARRRFEPFPGRLRFAFYGRTSTVDYQDRVVVTVLAARVRPEPDRRPWGDRGGVLRRGLLPRTPVDQTTTGSSPARRVGKPRAQVRRSGGRRVRTRLLRSALRHRSPAELEIENTFTRAIETDQSIDVPLVANAGDEPTDEQLDRQAAQGAAAVHAIFADAAAEQVLKGLDNVIVSQRQSGATFRILGAGVDYINVHDITITGNTATATGRAKVWMRT